MKNLFKTSKRSIAAILTLCILLGIAGTGLNVTKPIRMELYINHGGGNITMNIQKQIIKSVKAYIDGKLDRETLNMKLRIIHSKIFETQKNRCDEQRVYALIIHWIALTVPEVAYNEDEIRYVYKALIGETGYNLRYVYWIPTYKDECNETEQKILEISRSYIENCENNIQFKVFDNQVSYLQECDIEFIQSMYTNEFTRNEFGDVLDNNNVFFRCLLDLLKEGSIRRRSQHYDTDQYVMEKIKYFLAVYDKNTPICCNALLRNGNPIFVLC